MTAETDTILVRREGAVTVLTLNRPERLNAVSLRLYERLIEELARADADRETRCVILTGSGRAFCVGADLKAHGETPLSDADRDRYTRSAQEANYRIQSMGTPVVAAVNGHAIGAGLELALSADFMIVSELAKLRLPEISLGTFIGGGVVYTLAERVGVLKAREIVYMGDFFLGSEAAEMGLANAAVSTDDVMPVAQKWADRLAEKAPLSLAAAKRLIGPAGTMSRDEALELERTELVKIFGSADWKEGVDAFHEKRPPRYVGE
ncbi:MAG: enoyl-CoA hydratase/isomerase family protein [Gemmatimonadetes bacterium]|nr:enoyl-CoA hydratase/isomerase family protein [Gemmatimonadota bacterium]MDA1104509.1 enoyl-CoA hydratase/isomerase family protein [Gemmatimonadota bacterium]